MSAKEIVNELTNLGDLYDTSFMRESSYDNLRELLSKFYNNSYDITDLMESLTPRCSDILLECSFLNKKRKCTDIFSLGKTHNGFCCTFNYVIEPDDMPKFTEVPEPVIYLVGTASFYYGLSVMMVPQLDDYAYTLLPTTGWKVMIFDPYGYPDLSSGSVSEVLVPPLTEEFVQLQVVGSHGTDTIRMHSVEKRGCIFPDEYESNYTSYSTNACIVACRVEHIWAKCKCRPFFYPRQESRRTCTIEDIHCLTKYYEKQYNIVPYARINLDSDFENENVIRCNNCYPECIDMSYLIQISETDIKSSYFNVTLYPNTNVKDQSILHIYFSDPETGFLRKDVHYRWYEYLSFIGGTYGLFVGFSIVSVVEIIYFITSYLLETFLPPAAKKPSRKNTTRSIYWNEFLSHSRVNVERPAIRY
ncbi:PREDICTED: pickpocket protein 28-like [Habropoda laboriosa]|uniref:pickpocket protein 28-like n=1 Tax=Habropoda laboriosa TaxID=597456 RepID=UPI00083DCA9B|nr:PREDICTED: pickpocket protein 28-like [Habropoda laboriosa]